MIRTPLSPEKKLAKRYFAKTHKDTPDAKNVQDYLTEVHGIKVPENFSVKVTMAHRHYHGTGFQMNLSLVDSIVCACELWQEYVEDFDALVCREVLSMCRIHTSVVWVRNLGAEHKMPLKKQPPYYFRTQVSYTGEINVHQ